MNRLMSLDAILKQYNKEVTKQCVENLKGKKHIQIPLKRLIKRKKLKLHNNSIKNYHKYKCKK